MLQHCIVYTHNLCSCTYKHSASHMVHLLGQPCVGKRRHPVTMSVLQPRGWRASTQHAVQCPTWQRGCYCVCSNSVLGAMYITPAQSNPQDHDRLIDTAPPQLAAPPKDADGMTAASSCSSPSCWHAACCSAAARQATVLRTDNGSRPDTWRCMRAHHTHMCCTTSH